MKLIILIIALFLSTSALSNPDEKQNLASQFFDATTAKQIELIAASAANEILKKDPTKVRQAEIYKQWALETFSSKEYKKIYTEYLVERFDNNELIEMNKWAKSPYFLSYMVKWQGFPQWSQSKFQSFLKLKNPELVRRLKAEGFDTNSP